MRLSYLLLVAAVTLVSTLDAASAASGTTLSQPRTANAVDSINVHESIRNNRRFLRKHKVVKDDEEEERGWFTTKAIMAKFALAYAKNNTDEMQKILREVQDVSTIKAIYDKVEPLLQGQFANYQKAMGPVNFKKMVDEAADLTDEMKGMLTAAYSKYYSAAYLP